MKQDLIVIDLARVKKNLQYFTFMQDQDVAGVLSDLRVYSVNPDTLNLAALQVLGELKQNISKVLKRRPDEIDYQALFSNLPRDIESLESQHFSDLADLKETLVQAEAWSKIKKTFENNAFGWREFLRDFETEARRSLGKKEG